MRHLLRLADLEPATIRRLIDSAARAAVSPPRPLQGWDDTPTLALLLEKPSLRTRMSFELAMRRLGGTTIVLGAAEVGLNSRESSADIARTIACYAHALAARVYAHASLEQLAAADALPVINALSPQEHPCQALADLLTVRQEFGALAGRRLAYVGCGDNDVTRSLVLAAACCAMQVRVASPEGYTLDQDTLDTVARLAPEARVECGADARWAVADADVVATDTWIGAGKVAEGEAERPRFQPYQLNETLLARAASHAIVLHCMPANRGQEITDAVADGPASRMLRQARNRVFAQEALLRLILAPETERGL